MRPSQVHESLKFAFNEQHLTGLVPFLWGPPGAGKSAVVQQVCDEINAHLIDIRLSEHDASEIKGIDVPDIKKGALKRFLPVHL